MVRQSIIQWSRSRQGSLAFAILSVAVAILAICYGLLWAGEPHLGLEAESVADGTFRVSYVAPVGAANDAGIRIGDFLSDAEGGELVSRAGTTVLKNPSRVTKERGDVIEVIHAGDYQIVSWTEANVLYGMSLLFVASGVLAIAVRAWDPASWRLHGFLFSAGLLIAMGPVSGQRGNLLPAVATVGGILGMVHGALAWFSVFPHAAVTSDWRKRASEVSVAVSTVLFILGAISVLLFHGFFPTVRLLIAFYVAIGVGLAMLALVRSMRQDVPKPRRDQAKWVALLFTFTILPVVLVYLIPSLIGLRLTSPVSLLIGVSLLPVSILAVLTRYQLGRTGERMVAWALWLGVLFSAFAGGVFIYAAFLGDLVGATNDNGAAMLGLLTMSIVAAAILTGKVWARLSAQGRQQVRSGDRRYEIQIRNEERRRLLQEMHDGPLQTATALSLYSQVDGSEGLRIQLARKLVGELRVLLSTSPSDRLSQRLDEAVRHLSQQMEKYVNLPVTITVMGEKELEQLSPEKAAVLFHAVQEGLSNISKHAAATESRIHIISSNGLTQVTVQDNGRGFDTKSLSTRWDVPHGLALLKHRIDDLGGSLILTSAEGKGTKLEARMPHS